ncbi:Ribonuclease D [Candidatus Filomicrobium marinum]|uniref:Ribonuclease D n=2 Tax=Filomicrobium TaxID=119044 RepID=A0A0D6JLH9_9HYPH|nr:MULTISPECIES: ribonuclease D [Filomicrobium]MCV0369079.1 ribonuclease D [Filomicrobium sp.]CFX62238.1 Ribonuclease D [Candidatus Filomicrobium marinum]CPR22495.1 Ribonuclease D [Candidatus Filomicrobium marinum]SDO82333.1 ribonuclease D [Filomicrobium insigne]
MKLITTPSALHELCHTLSSADFITVDTEFMREQTYWPKLCLIQVASDDVEAIIDPLAPDLDLTPLWSLMTDSKIMKVFHAARQDIEIVHIAAGRVPSPVFDTQVAAMVCGFGESISYINLTKKITGADLDKSSRFTDWSRRPLSEKQLNYALGDVTHLRDIYRHLKNELETTGRASWLDEEMGTLTASETYEQNPETAWRRLKLKVRNRKALGVLMELAAWRETAAQNQDVPRQRIMRDDALYDIANQSPTSVEQLSGLRSLSDGFARSARAKEIVAAVRRGLDRDPSTVPPLSQGQPLSAEATATLELLKVLLKSAAARHRVAPRLIADASDLERLARENEPDVAALTGWRRQLFGEDALRLKNGELALTLKAGDVRIVTTNDIRVET